ncbi:n-(5'-phosphoribosyl)anthranilate isomerase [Methanoculleus sp. CAG:1088]|nr:n-(5'-phosphoribosyl)anthranilate isomerase [Methanoculleus sp. CAG:1088]
MTRIKFCGIRREEDVGYVNLVRPDYASFVLAPGFRRTVSAQEAGRLSSLLDEGIVPVGVFVDEPPENVARLLEDGTISIAQLHGMEDEEYLSRLRDLTSGTLMKCFRVSSRGDVEAASCCSADLVMLDSGTGTGKAFDWSLAEGLGRDFFLAGGLDPSNVGEAIKRMHPTAVDTSSGIETDGFKDYEKMEAFVKAVRSADGE